MKHQLYCDTSLTQTHAHTHTHTHIYIYTLRVVEEPYVWRVVQPPPNDHKVISTTPKWLNGQGVILAIYYLVFSYYLIFYFLLSIKHVTI
jgi:hypothetical protein